MTVNFKLPTALISKLKRPERQASVHQELTSSQAQHQEASSLSDSKTVYFHAPPSTPLTPKREATIKAKLALCLQGKMSYADAIDASTKEGAFKKPCTDVDKLKSIASFFKEQLVFQIRNRALDDKTVIDLSGADLSGRDLNGVNLSHVNLTEANLIGANLTDANITYANLTRANVIGANLTGASRFLKGLITDGMITDNQSTKYS